MSEENVEIVRRVYEAVARRDSAAVLSLYDPDVEITFVRGTLADQIGIAGEGPVYRGHEGLSAFDRELRQAFDKFETTYEELIEAGEKVVSISRYQARGRESGIEIAGPLQFGVWTIRDGKVIQASWFPDRETAIEAAELPE